MTNLEAFLLLIRTGEGTLGDAGYSTLYGGGHFDSFADHPRIKVTAGGITSSAAGAYQILAGTWDGLRAQHADLTDFGPTCQDKAAIYLIKGRGAYDDVVAGRFTAAITKCNREWASLPGSPYGQPTLTLARALKILTDAGAQPAAASPATASKENTVDPITATVLETAIPKLFSALPDLVSIFKKPDVASRNVEALSKVGDIIMSSVPTATNMQDAVTKVISNPQTASDVNAAIRLSRADIMDALEKLNGMEQANIGAARTYNSGEQYLLDTPWIKLKFIHLLSLVFVGFSGTFVSINWTSLTPELKGAVITLMVIAGWNGVRDYWMGSSEGSTRKTELLQGK